LCIEKAILASLAYFDIFEYPLNRAEIYQFLPESYSYEVFKNALDRLCRESWVCQFDDLYSLQNKPELVLRRKEGNKRAEVLLRKAEKIAGFLSHFPYVRGVAVSGSLSKHFADKNSDIDFFIITEKNRLWIARTFMHLFKKFTFLVNKQHWFCMNYYIDEEEMQIKEKNIYTAIEVTTLIPFRGMEVFRNFYIHNAWTIHCLPNHSAYLLPGQNARTSIFKKLTESFFRNAAGDRIEQYLMRLTANRWAEKTEQRKLNSRGIILGMDTSMHYAKPDPRNFQIKLVDQYERKISHLLSLFDEVSTQALAGKTA
jgi:predicted nucleotidyltransferase